VKRQTSASPGAAAQSFSILERIDVGETSPNFSPSKDTCRLSVSSNGSTWVKRMAKVDGVPQLYVPFSILERIDVGETSARRSLT